ncbi:two-component system response regulator [Enterococcus silesiacus]|uniref:Two-component system response regulator n=1 Tax=Enterococcus silesiacus TaxID=332949 RepID=A0A0S3KA79_9ENTE|nr:response regulator [Enterococcus silesiacus]ALS01211.1 two-component system response regulator [Enterococcus silesiacus]OJG92611.1 hypothetical protein RV15_GL003036 [Enterococcus silesiacus]
MTNVITILLVDDEVAIRDGLKHLLQWEKFGFHIVGEAENGKIALDKIIELQPDIVITDLIMPELDGLELSKIIQEQFPQIHFLVLSSYDEFTYVSESFKNGAVDYLLKPTLTKENLLTALNKIATKLAATKATVSEEEVLSQTLNRYLVGYKETDLSPVANFLTYDCYQLVYTNTIWYQDRDNLQRVLNELTFDNTLIKSLAYATSNDEAGLLLAFRNVQPNSQTMLMKKLYSLRQIEAGSFFTLSEPFFQINQLKKTFSQLKAGTKEQRFYFKHHFIVEFNELYMLKQRERFDTKKFLRAILNNDFLLGIVRIEEFFNEMILSFSSASDLKQQASNIFYTLLSSLEEAYPHEDSFSKLKTYFLNQIGKMSYLEDFSALILTMNDQIRQILQQQNPRLDIKENELITSIERYIRDNYQSDLSLARLAEEFHFSYNYLSSFFSAHFKMTFSDYLNTVRLEAARKLLLTSNDNLSEISVAAGYSDLSYFSRLFKREYHVTPSVYRRENRL